LFYTCPTTEQFRDEFFRWAYNEANQYVISRHELFLVQVENNIANSRSVIKTLIAKLYMKYIWDCRNRSSIPELELAKEFLVLKIKTITGISTVMREHHNDSGLAAIFFALIGTRKISGPDLSKLIKKLIFGLFLVSLCTDPVQMDPEPAQGFLDPGFNTRIGKCEIFLFEGLSSFPTEVGKRMSNFNLQYTYI
jgi:hypothetical protein